MTERGLDASICKERRHIRVSPCPRVQLSNCPSVLVLVRVPRVRVSNRSGLVGLSAPTLFPQHTPPTVLCTELCVRSASALRPLCALPSIYKNLSEPIVYCNWHGPFPKPSKKIKKKSCFKTELGTAGCRRGCRYVPDHSPEPRARERGAAWRRAARHDEDSSRNDRTERRAFGLMWAYWAVASAGASVRQSTRVHARPLFQIFYPCMMWPMAYGLQHVMQ